MNNIKKYDEELYRLAYESIIEQNYKIFWSEIRKNKDLLKEAIKVNINDNGIETLNAITICDFILKDYKNIDKEIYNKLVNIILNNRNISRTKINNRSAANKTFLLRVINNKNNIIENKEKELCVSEATNTVAIKRQNKIEKISEIHGMGTFDIRYYILKNPNWSINEKRKLLRKFYSYEEWERTLKEFELAVIYNNANFKGNPFSLLTIDSLYNYSYDELLNFYNNKEITNYIWNEIEFCKLMHKLRPIEEKQNTKKLKRNKKI